MKKSWIVTITFVMVMSTLSPPHLVYGEQPEEDCVEMAFDVGTVLEEDDTLEGNALPGSEIELGIGTYEDAEHVQSDGRYEFDIKALELSEGESVILKNELHEIQTEVKEEDFERTTIESELPGECPISEEPIEESEEANEDEESEEETQDESSEESAIPRDEETAEEEEDNEEQSEEEISEDEAPEDVKSEEDAESEKESEEPSEAEESETSNSEEDVENVKESSEKTTSNNESESNETEELKDDEIDRNDTVHEEPTQSEETSNNEEAVEPADENTNDGKDEAESEDMPEEESDLNETDDHSSEKAAEEEMDLDQEISEYEALKVQDSDEQLIDDLMMVSRSGMAAGIQPYQTPGLIDVELLAGTELDAEHNLRNNIHEITLTYSGSGVIDLGLLRSTYTNFYLPPEIAKEITGENLSATYDVPRVSVIVPIIRSTGSFEEDDINVEGSHVYMSFDELLSLNLLTPARYYFTLTIKLDELPPTKTGEYVFHSVTSNQLVDLSLISDDGTATATLPAPQIPETPVINEPVYSDDDLITGTGTPETSIIIRIGDEEYRGQVDEEGNYEVEIPAQVAGTEIRGVIENDAGHESDEASVTVIDPLEAPELAPIYSNDTTVTGDGIPGMGIELEIGGEIYDSVVDPDGGFSVDIPAQAPGTLITATLFDENGMRSYPSEEIVREATLAFYNVPTTISFEDTSIRATPGKMRIPRRDSEWTIEVEDTRGAGSEFQILAQTTQPLATPDGTHSLPEALVYVDEENNSHSVYNNAVEVFSGTTGDNPLTTLSWPEDEGVLVEVDPIFVRAEEYRTSINWTLVDGPQGTE